ncbi:MAG: DUF4912 domain-containing protein [Planctomycetota bacterium]
MAKKKNTQKKEFARKPPIKAAPKPTLKKEPPKKAEAKKIPEKAASLRDLGKQLDSVVARKKAPARAKRPSMAPKPAPPPEPIKVQAEAPAPPITGPYIDRGADLPAGFGDDQIHALVRDPDWVFVYWELFGDGSNHLVQTRGGGKEFTQLPWHLRVLDQGGSIQQEIAVYVGANNWYVRTGEAKLVSLQIGFYDQGGEFVVAASTEQVATPRGAPSADRSETWMRRVRRGLVKPGEMAYVLEPADVPPGGAAELTQTSDRPGSPTSPGRFPPSGRPVRK